MTQKTYEACEPQHLAFLGLGVMGFHMAGHLAQAGHHVTVYNRNAAKAKAWLEQFKGVAAATPREAAAQAQIVFCCVGNDDDLRAVTLGSDGAFAGMQKGSYFVDNTTASAQVARELYQQAKSMAVGFLDAPVSGGEAGAKNGVLTVMVGGDQADFDAVKPAGMAFARAFTRIGE
ncbi:MAG: 2-hydroxy-3-oxopropionate reductase, partial [Pseudomonadota bacterium]